MNYEQARQIGPNGPAPGKWNWTNFNDGIAPNPYTIAPCRDPDLGKERCDHDTRQEAERHHWRYEMALVQLVPFDAVGARERYRCDVSDCPNWEDFYTRWPDGYRMDHLCLDHATFQDVVKLHPYDEREVQVIHS